MADTEQPVEQPQIVPDTVQEVINTETTAAVPRQPPIQAQFLPEDSEYHLAKSFLQSKVGVKHPVSVYDHLTNIIMQTLETRNSNVVDNFEQMSLLLKQNQFTVDAFAPTSIRVEKEPNVQLPVAKNRLEILKKSTMDESNEGEIPDMMDLAALWEWAGVSFGKEETYLLFLSIRKLVEQKHLKSIRLWGKILGRDANYIIAEAELKEGVEDTEDAIVNAIPPTDVPEKKDHEGPVLPKPKQFSPMTKEQRVGVNKYVYFACNYIGGPWTRLPDVIPERLQEARKIRKYFTGNLKHQIQSYPPFRGTEAQYLRCQIARISAATVVSPKGYYMTDPEADEPEEGAGNMPIIINPEYEGLLNDQLLNVSNWVHHTPYILPQGRVTWEAPKLIKEEEKEEEEEEEEENVVEPEQGPAPLTAISSDEDHGSIPAWSTRACSQLSPLKFSTITLRSNRWPGASVIAYNDKFANIYIGDGLKDLGNPQQDFVATPLGPIQKEYAIGENNGNPELLIEQMDPSVEQEEQYEEEKGKAEGEGEGEADGEGDDEE